MGGICASKIAKHGTNTPHPCREMELEESEGDIHILITGIDYACDRQSWAGPPPNGHGPLDTKFAWDMMVNLAKTCVPAANIHTMWNEQCTKDGICEKIAQVAGDCTEGDTFVFYYTGHGDRLPQNDAEEGEDMDNCLCTVGPDGATDDAQMQLRNDVWLRDDDLAAAIAENVAEGVKVLVLADCCHSGSICDFGPGSPWDENDVKAISMAGCTDTQTSAGTGQGGMFSRALSKTIEDLDGEENISIAHIYNYVLEHYRENKNAGHTQNITINKSLCEPDEFIWPFRPEGYVSPFKDEQ